MTIIGAILIVGMVITIHELGHFIAAKFTGIAIAVFSLGFGRPISGFMWNNTAMFVSLFPVGGYVAPYKE